MIFKIVRVIIDTIKIEDFDFNNILINEKSYVNIKTFRTKLLMGAKPMRIRFDKVNEFIRVYDRTRYLVLFVGEKYDFISNRMRYLIGVKSGIIYVISHNWAKIKVFSYDSLFLEKRLTLHNVIILIKSLFNKDENNYYGMFLEKDSYELPKNNDSK